MTSFLHTLVNNGNFAIAAEAYSDVSLFLGHPDAYLERAERRSRGNLTTAPLSTGGEVTEEILRIAKELVSIQAYNSALTILNQYRNRIDEFIELYTKEERQNLNVTMNFIDETILDVIQSRDDYQAKKRSILSKYRPLFDDLCIDEGE